MIGSSSAEVAIVGGSETGPRNTKAADFDSGLQQRDCNNGTATMARYEFTVSVVPRYMAEQSDPNQDEYLFTYTVTVRNTGEVAAKLLSRHWIITDADGDVEEVRGEGVVGEQPVLRPGEAFEYTSSCPLTTPVGSMKGSYQCVAEDGTRFTAAIPEFILASPRVLH
jgi:ApaG protein